MSTNAAKPTSTSSDKASPPRNCPRTARRELTELVDHAGPGEDKRAGRMARFYAETLGDSLASVATGSIDTTIEEDWSNYTERRAGLGKNLQESGVNPELQSRIWQPLDHHARESGKLGRPAAERRARWRAKTEYLITTRNKAITRVKALAAGRDPAPAATPARPRPSAVSRPPAKLPPTSRGRGCTPPATQRGVTAMSETVDLVAIARLDEATAVVDLYRCEVFYDADNGVETGPGVAGAWGSLAAQPGLPVTLDALDETMTDLGYRRTTTWRKRVTASGAVRYFANAQIRIENI
ncbi:hypothetical protein [Nocardia cyriacigeorgica]|uniref:hypothetical protein n=1 Tax=Nocardia cyriacigeorgica TaxID=135487 RepID=UPI00245661F0|nr:hypothetical protein [Nocardia cyriacigeorgica]